MKHIPLVILCLATVTSAFAKIPVGPPKNAAYTLATIVDDDNSEPFACMLGTFRVKVKNENPARVEATLEGAGLLMNSRWLHTSVASNLDITYRFPENAKVHDGMKLTMVCNSSKEIADVTYFVPHREKKLE